MFYVFNTKGMFDKTFLDGKLGIFMSDCKFCQHNIDLELVQAWQTLRV